MNIYAHTDCTGASYPAYISINRLDTGAVAITVRSPRKTDGSCGNDASIVLTQEEFSELARKVYGTW